MQKLETVILTKLAVVFTNKLDVADNISNNTAPKQKKKYFLRISCTFFFICISLNKIGTNSRMNSSIAAYRTKATGF